MNSNTLRLLLFLVCNCLYGAQGSLLYWSGSTKGTVSLHGSGRVDSSSSTSMEWSLVHPLGDLPYPVEFYGSSRFAMHSKLSVEQAVQIETINLAANSTTPFSMNWEYLGLAIPFYKKNQSSILRPRSISFGMEWHFLEYSLNEGSLPSLLHVDRSISAFTLQPEWQGNWKGSSWEWFLKPRGVRMQDLGGTPAAHMEGEVGFRRGRLSLGFKRKKTRIFPSDRAAQGGVTPSDLIFIRDGWYAQVQRSF